MSLNRAKQCAAALFMTLSLTLLAANLTTAVESAPSQEKQEAKPEKLAEETYKNIQMFKGMPASRVMAAMSFFTRALGVRCDHCPVPGAFEKDDKPPKATARQMYAMVQLTHRTLGSN